MLCLHVRVCPCHSSGPLAVVGPSPLAVMDYWLMSMAESLA